jgi:asparagine synthase (glutamine-hydrolysing)
MCGIVGIFAYRDTSNPIDRAELRRMRDDMAVRGPDAAGEWVADDERVALGHRRLAIIDLSERATQPMSTSDGRLHITFNGEIYNYRTLRSELEHKGYSFRTTSDTEVLLQLYRERGVDMFSALRGMYAFGLWDDDARTLVLARDAYGIKPLYYANERGTLRFASQVRALLASNAVSRARSSAADVGFHLWGSVPEPHTPYRSITALPAGTHLVVRESGPGLPAPHDSIARAWATAEQLGTPPGAAQEHVRSALCESVASHLVADVPVSIFLSAGIDSSALAGVMSDTASVKTHAITLEFAEFAGRTDDETPLAATVARHYGLTHHVRRVEQEEFQRDLPEFLAAMDQPSIDGLNTWFVSKATAELGLKVAISGLGGDELFGGYPSFEQVPRLSRALRLPARVPQLGSCLRRVASRHLPLMAAHPKWAGVLEYGGSVPGAYWLKRGLFMPWELPAILPEDWVRDGLEQLAPEASLATLLTPAPRSAWVQVAVLEASSYLRNQLLRDTDWASMAHSLEVRVPLVDRVLLGQLGPALTRARGEGKQLLAQSPRLPLPAAVQQRRKTGFSTPLARWLQTTDALAAWRTQPTLAHPRCPWARRYAYAVAQSYYALHG